MRLLQNGHLEVLNGLIGNGCQWSGNDASAMNGHLKMLKWARELGCPWSSKHVPVRLEMDNWKL
jgi:hypothetical protein